MSSPEFLFECFKDQNLLKVVEYLHFNPDHPENHNVRIKNINQGLMEAIENGQWKIYKKDELLHDLVYNGWRILNTYYRKNKEDIKFELEDDEISESVEWLNKIFKEDSKLMKELKTDIFILVLNNKAILIQKI